MKNVKERIRVKGYSGTWYEIDKTIWHDGKTYYLMESEQYGDETPWIIIDEENKIVKDIFGYNIDDVYNDINSELEERMEA